MVALIHMEARSRGAMIDGQAPESIAKGYTWRQEEQWPLKANLRSEQANYKTVELLAVRWSWASWDNL